MTTIFLTQTYDRTPRPAANRAGTRTQSEAAGGVTEPRRMLSRRGCLSLPGSESVAPSESESVTVTDGHAVTVITIAGGHSVAARAAARGRGQAQ